MAVQSVRTESIAFTGDLVGVESYTSGTNSLSPGQVQVIVLSTGANTITVPSITALIVPVAVTIIPPAANAIAITLKGVSGDTGIRIHNTDPTTIAIDPSVVNFVLNAASTVNGVRLVWA